MKVLSWNLFHGRAGRPGARPRNADLRGEFGDVLAGWDWDVALLQEVPPWWARPLAERTGASMRMALTSRNELPGLRRALASRWPDVVKSNGGGCNAILVRGAPVLAHAQALVRRRPERRRVHAVRLRGGVWVANLHGSKQPRERPAADLALAAEHLDAWSDGGPAVLGGDLNFPDPAVPGFVGAASRGVDHVLVRGAAVVAGAVLDAGPLSDHRPILATLAWPAGTW